MALAFAMALVVAYIETTKAVSRQEIVVVQIVASFVVGLSAGLIALSFPGTACFGAIALGGVLNILQGFRIVFAVVEIMSRHTVAGSADLIEGMVSRNAGIHFEKDSLFSHGFRRTALYSAHRLLLAFWPIHGSRSYTRSGRNQV